MTCYGHSLTLLISCITLHVSCYMDILYQHRHWKILLHHVEIDLKLSGDVADRTTMTLAVQCLGLEGSNGHKNGHVCILKMTLFVFCA
jgi:hypothetical protein